MSADLGQITTKTSPLVWAIGVTRDPSIQFTKLSGDVQVRSSYYQMNFSTPHDMVFIPNLSLYFDANAKVQVSFFLNDFDNALNLSTQLDDQIINDAENISPLYSDLLSLVARQAMSALEITVSKNSDGSFNSSDVMAFIKDMNDDGTGGYDLTFQTFQFKF